MTLSRIFSKVVSTFLFSTFFVLGLIQFQAKPYCFTADQDHSFNPALDQKIHGLFAEFDRSGRAALDLMGDEEYRKTVRTRLKEDSRREVSYDVSQPGGNPFEFFDLEYNR